MTSDHPDPVERDYLSLSPQARRFLRAALESQAAHHDTARRHDQDTASGARRAYNTWTRVQANTSQNDQDAALAVLLRHEARPLAP